MKTEIPWNLKNKFLFLIAKIVKYYLQNLIYIFMYKYIQRIEHMKTAHLGAQHVLHVIIIFYNSRTMI